MRMAAAHQKKQDSEEDVMSVDNIYASNLTKLIS
jgi:hypothetical protein